MYTGPNIVTDGLVLYLDAANTKSYTSGSTIVRSLTGTITGSLVNGVGFSTGSNGSWVFDGSDDYMNFGNILNSVTELTVNFWIQNPNNNVIVTKGYQKWEIRFNATEFGGYVGINNGTSYWSGIADSYNVNHGTDLTKWNNFTYVLDYLNDTIKFYANSSFKGSINVPNMFSTHSPAYDLNIGRRTEGGSAYLSGSLSNIQIYNRALSATEIQQNYNATKSRFNL
jgi:hypothetical protein